MNVDPNGPKPGDGTDDDGDGNAKEADTDEEKPGDSGDDEAVEGSQDNDDTEGETGGIAGLAITMLGGVWSHLADGLESFAKDRSQAMADQITGDLYMTTPPSGGLVDIYEQTSDWAKPGAIALLLILALSMTLRGANYNTAYAAQYGIPKIVAVMARIAFFPEVVNMLVELTDKIAQAVVDEQELQKGLEQLYTGSVKRLPLTPFVWLIKGIFSILILFAIAVNKFIFGILFLIGPLAMLFHALPRFSDVAGAWLRGILACMTVPVLWALEFGLGYRLVADPSLIFANDASSGPWPVVISIAILYMVWKTPWKVYEWAFYSYSSGGTTESIGKTALGAILKKPSSTGPDHGS